VAVVFEVQAPGRWVPHLVGYRPPEALAVPRVEQNPLTDGCRREERGMTFLNHRSVLMVDWDLPSPDHPEQCATIKTRQEAVERLEAWFRDNPVDSWDVYDTPGGVRAFLLSRWVPAGSEEMRRVHKALGGDPVYSQRCGERGYYGVRVSPKPGRKGDYVARRVRTVWGTQPSPAPSGMFDFLVRHDREVEKYEDADRVWNLCGARGRAPEGYEKRFDVTDATARLVFADFLDEHDDPRAAAYRLSADGWPRDCHVWRSYARYTFHLRGKDGCQPLDNTGAPLFVAGADKALVVCRAYRNPYTDLTEDETVVEVDGPACALAHREGDWWCYRLCVESGKLDAWAVRVLYSDAERVQLPLEPEEAVEEAGPAPDVVAAPPEEYVPMNIDEDDEIPF
jgi:hypothetical protein